LERTKLDHFKKLGTKLNQQFKLGTKLKTTITTATCHNCKLPRGSFKIFWKKKF